MSRNTRWRIKYIARCHCILKLMRLISHIIDFFSFFFAHINATYLTCLWLSLSFIHEIGMPWMEGIINTCDAAITSRNRLTMSWYEKKERNNANKHWMHTSICTVAGICVNTIIYFVCRYWCNFLTKNLNETKKNAQFNYFFVSVEMGKVNMHKIISLTRLN